MSSASGVVGHFPDLSKPPFNGNEDLQANLIMPEPTVNEGSDVQRYGA
jgi:hypothetical protein